MTTHSSKRRVNVRPRPMDSVGPLGAPMQLVLDAFLPTSSEIRGALRRLVSARTRFASIGEVVSSRGAGFGTARSIIKLTHHIGVPISLLGACLPVTPAIGASGPATLMPLSHRDDQFSFRYQATSEKAFAIWTLKGTPLGNNIAGLELLDQFLNKERSSAGFASVASEAAGPSFLTADPQTTGSISDGASRPESPAEAFAGQSDSSRKLVSFSSSDSSSPGPDADPNQLLTLFRDAFGQTVASLDEIDAVMRQDQVFSDIRTLQDRITDTQRPVANLVVRHSNQSDRLDITQTEVSQDVYLGQGRVQARLGFQDVEYRAPNAQGISEYSPGFTANARINDVSSIAGEFWLNRIDYGRAGTTVPTYDVFFTVRPNDYVRIDIDTNRRTFDNILSLALGITAQTYGGSVDVMPVDGVKVTFRGSGAAYSDHNNRRSEEIEGVWRLRTNPVIFELGLRGTNFHYTRLLSDGYFNPDNYYSGEVLFRLQSTLAKKLIMEAAGSAGVENADPGGTKPLIKGSLQAVYKLSNGWSLEGEAAHFSSRESSSSGFSRTSFTAGLHYRF